MENFSMLTKVIQGSSAFIPYDMTSWFKALDLLLFAGLTLLISANVKICISNSVYNFYFFTVDCTY